MFLYAFVSGVSINFPHLFLRSLNEVRRSSVVGHTLIHPIFIHRILLFLGLNGFPSSEPVHVVAPIGATFLRQRATHLRVSPSRPRGASSSVIPPPSSFIGADAAEPSGAAADADVPPPTTLNDSDIRHKLDHVLTVQRLMDRFWWTCSMRSVPCVRSWRSLDPLPFDDGFCLPFGIPSQKGGVLCRVFVFRGRVFLWLELVQFRLYLGTSFCILPF